MLYLLVEMLLEGFGVDTKFTNHVDVLKFSCYLHVIEIVIVIYNKSN